MTDASQILAFLRARLDDKERVARAAMDEIAAWGGSWAGFTDDIAHRAVIEADVMCDHMAAHDPAQVLREVAAKRLILDAHPVEGPSKYVPFQYCGTCQDLDGIVSGPAPCPTLRALALPYDQHPDFREEWRV